MAPPADDTGAGRRGKGRSDDLGLLKSTGIAVSTAVIWLVLALGVLVVDYMLTMIVAVNLVPTIGASLASGFGIDLNAVSPGGLIVWAISTLAFALVLVTGALVAMRAIWKGRGHVYRVLTRNFSAF